MNEFLSAYWDRLMQMPQLLKDILVSASGSLSQVAVFWVLFRKKQKIKLDELTVQFFVGYLFSEFVHEEVMKKFSIGVRSSRFLSGIGGFWVVKWMVSWFKKKDAKGEDIIKNPLE